MPKDPNSKTISPAPVVAEDTLTPGEIIKVAVAVPSGVETPEHDFGLTPDKPQPISHFTQFPKVDPNAPSAPEGAPDTVTPMTMAEFSHAVLTSTNAAGAMEAAEPMSPTIAKLVKEAAMAHFMSGGKPKAVYEMRAPNGRLVATRTDW